MKEFFWQGLFFTILAAVTTIYITERQNSSILIIHNMPIEISMETLSNDLEFQGEASVEVFGDQVCITDCTYNLTKINIDLIEGPNASQFINHLKLYWNLKHSVIGSPKIMSFFFFLRDTKFLENNQGFPVSLPAQYLIHYSIPYEDKSFFGKNKIYKGVVSLTVRRIVL